MEEPGSNEAVVVKCIPDRVAVVEASPEKAGVIKITSEEAVAGKDQMINFENLQVKLINVENAVQDNRDLHK